MMKESTTISTIKGKTTVIDHEAEDNKPKKGDSKKLPSMPRQQENQGTGRTAMNWATFVTGIKTVALCIKHLVNYKQASQILTTQRLDRRDQAFCTKNHFSTNKISNAAALKTFANPKLDAQVMSAQLGKLMEPHTRGLTFDLNAFKQDVATNFPQKVTSHALSTVDTDQLGQLKLQFLTEGRKDKADALQVIIDAYTEPSTPEGARKFFFSDANEVMAKGKPGSFLRGDGESAPIVGFLKPHGLDSLENQLKPQLEKITDKGLVKILGPSLEEPREALNDSDLVENKSVSSISSRGFTKEEVSLLLVLADDVLDILAKAKPDKQLVSSIKEVTDVIQKRVGEGNGKITQDQANEMIRTVYTNAIILRVVNPTLNGLQSDGKLFTILTALVQNIANGQAYSDNISDKLKSPELIKGLEEKGDALLRKLEKILVKQFYMPEACAIKPSKPEKEEPVDFEIVEEEIWEEVWMEDTTETKDTKGKGEDKDDKF